MTWALLLILLICPIMMFFMHRGHGNHNHDEHNRKSSEEVDNIDNYQFNQLEGEIEYLKAQNELLQKQLEAPNRDAIQR